jgi:glycosyltransferase involved in cell wall biosynthesis
LTSCTNVSDCNPFFSIVIPTYNRAEQVCRALNSIAKQTFSDFEVIVCDDGSNDITEQVVASFTNQFPVIYLWENNWGGPARPRNRGISEAKGEWICFLDSDDWWYSNKLETVKKYLDNHDTDVVYHDLDIYTSKGKLFWKKARGKRFKKPVLIDLLNNGSGPPNSSSVVRKEIIYQVGGLSEDELLIAVEDYDLWLKISRVTDKFCYIPQTLGAYWHGGGHITELSDRQIARVENIYNKYEMFLSHQDKKEIYKVFSYVKGRIKQRMGCFDEAQDLLKVSVSSNRLSIRLKSMALILWIYFNKNCHDK